MKLFWCRFFTEGQAFEETEHLPFHSWVSGYQVNYRDDDSDDIEVRCALIEAVSERGARAKIRKWFIEPRIDFIDEKQAGWTPGDRFPLYPLHQGDKWKEPTNAK